ncbi:hypothetical protein JHK85_036440 [Glycine max]|nr:hypothetical protein JHK85_036440 [Glycine max]KAG4976372.1 hypothetical protein JHK86_035846 [Glycine max]
MPTVSCTSNVAYQNVNAHPSLTASRLQDGKILVLDSIAFFASGFAACSSFKDEGASAANVSFWSVGVSENKNDDYDCESEGPYGTRSSAALIVTSSEEVSFFEAYLDEGMWKEHVIDFHIQKLKKLTKGHT